MNLVLLILSGIIAGLAFIGMKSRLLSLLSLKKLYVENYSGKKVLTGGGLLILFPCLLASLPFYLLQPASEHVLYTAMMPVFVFCGLLDDILGDSASKGLAGHFRTFMNGRMSTGMLKAIVGVLFGFFLALSRSSSFFIVTMDVLLFSLSVNFINLLDLRPGRAVKVFSFFTLAAAVLTGFLDAYLLLPVAVVLALYIGGELEEQYMLGDAGSNLLGGIMGYYGVAALSLHAKGILVVFLILMHILSEYKSISKIIDEVPLLKKIDMLGRKRGR
ncbi:MAG TPA: hypothetical protein GX505_05140 [Clostridiales bacterium]|nr:hypothetical protein [Clostridiales bacterium]